MASDLPNDQPRCPKCGYILLGLTEFRCPECGSPFDPVLVEDPALRSLLLPWERPELGGRVRRFVKTLFLVWFHPGRFFSSLNERKERRIARAASFILVCVTLSICVHVVLMVLERAVYFLRLLLERGHAWSAYDTVVKTLQITASTFLLLPALQLLWMVLAVVAIAFFLIRVFRKRVGFLHTTDLAAALSPAVLLGALIWGMTAVIIASLKYQFPGIAGVAVWAQPVILLSLVWFCCRNLLSLNRRGTVGILLICCALLYLCGVVGVGLLLPLSKLIRLTPYG